MPIPKGLTMEEASALPEAYATSYLNLFIEGHLEAGQTAFIPAGASGLLSILFPENFGTIDQYVVKALKEVKGIPYTAELTKMNPDSLSIKDGVLLIRIMREQAIRLNGQFDTDFWTPRKIDMVFWSIGRVRK